MASDVIISKVEAGPLDRFKNQNLVLKKFGEDGLRVYNSIDGASTAGDILAKLELPEDKFVSILEFLEQGGMITVAAASEAPSKSAQRLSVAPSQPMEPSGDSYGEPLIRPIMPEESPSASQGAKKGAKRQAAQEQETQPEQQPYNDSQDAQEGQGDSGTEDSTSQQAQEPESYYSRQQREEVEDGDGQSQGAQGFSKPESPSRKKRRQSDDDDESSGGNLKPKPARQGDEQLSQDEEPAQKMIEPLDSQGKTHPEDEQGEKEPTPPSQDEAAQQEKESKYHDEGPGSETEGYIKKADLGSTEPQSKLSAKEAEDTASLSPIEKIIYNKFGKTGVLVYNLVDGEKTAEEIMLETGLSEMKLVEILEFMENQGIIKLEKPSGEEPEAPPPAGSQPPSPDAPPSADAPPEPESEFRPLAEDENASGSVEASQDTSEFSEIVPIDVPIPASTNPVSAATNKAQLLFKYKSEGSAVLGLVDGKRDTIAISVETKMSLGRVDEILGYLGSQKSVYFKPLSREEIRQQYGDDGLSVFKKFGREGVLLYELIGKEPSLKDIILRSKVEPARAIDIVIFIHSLLGIDIPLSKEVLYKQLGISG